MSNIGHRSLFNQLLSNLLIDNTRDLVIFLNERSLSDHHFRAMIAFETTLFKEDSSRHTSRFEVRNLRGFFENHISSFDIRTQGEMGRRSPV